MRVTKTENGIRYEAWVQCPYCKNPDLGQGVDHDPEVGQYKFYQCSCKAKFRNYPIKWREVDGEKPKPKPKADVPAVQAKLEEVKDKTMKLKTKFKWLFLYFRFRRWWWRFTEALPFFGKGIRDRRLKAFQKAYDEHLKTLPPAERFRRERDNESIKRKLMPPDQIGDDLGAK
jgi:hypothetical protein